MVTGIGNDEKGDIILLGLSRANIERLLAGKPVAVTPEKHNLPSYLRIFIVFGETEDAIWDQLKAQGCVDQRTAIRKDGLPLN